MSPNMGVGLVAECARNTGLTIRELLYISQTAPKRYKVYPIPKRSGGFRTICQPSRELKAIQYYFLKNVIKECKVHSAAMAYEEGRSIRHNAEAHVRSRVILKTDFSSFFPSIRVSDWKLYVDENFPDWSYADFVFSSYVLFWGAGTTKPVCLSIGAPTSPKLSNILMFRFDQLASDFADSCGMTYTRYADDITFSSEGFLDFDKTMEFMRSSLKSLPYPNLRVNDAKTGVFSRKHALRVTGLTIANSNTVSLGRERKRLISALIHKYSLGLLGDERISELSGLLSFAHDAEPEFVVRMTSKYGQKIMRELEVWSVPTVNR